MAANDKATEEAISNLASMFSTIDKEMITDIYLGCKKNFDQTVDQLVNMGAELEDKKPTAPLLTPLPTPLNNNNNNANAQPHYPSSPPPSVKQGEGDCSFMEEKNKLEALNLQLSDQYKRLAATQESNVQLVKHLDIKRAEIAAEQQRVDNEKKKLEEQQLVFQQDKKKLEEHLSARLREMKEEMRKSEEEAKERERANRMTEETERQERAAKEEESRLAIKEEKRRAKEERRVAKQNQKQQEASELAFAVSAEQQATINALEKQYENDMSEMQHKSDNLQVQVQELESYIHGLESDLASKRAEEEARTTQPSVADTLSSLSKLLLKASIDLKTTNNNGNLTQALFRSLPNVHDGGVDGENESDDH